MTHTGDEVLRLKWFADEFISFYGEGALGYGTVDHAGHQDDRRAAEVGMLFDELTDLVAVFVWHDDVTDDDVRAALFKLTEGAGCVTVGDDVDVFATEGDLDHLAHGGAVVNEIDRGCSAHDAPPVANPSSSPPPPSSSS